MTLQQLKFICEVVNCGLSVSKAAASLHTSQPSMSRQIQALENELGMKIFLRSKRRLIELTKPGEQVHELARKALSITDGMRHIRNDFYAMHAGSLVVATSHTQARYVLPKVIQHFKKRYPQLQITLRQGNPTQIAQWVSSGEADLSIGGEPTCQIPGIALLTCFDEYKIVLTPRKHPLANISRLTIAQLSRYPLITYDSNFRTNAQISEAFAKKNRKPNIILNATNPDVMKPYVRCGLGIAIVGECAYDPKEDSGLRAIEAKHLFEPTTIYCGIRKHTYIRRYVFDLIKFLAPNMTQDKLSQAVFLN